MHPTFRVFIPIIKYDECGISSVIVRIGVHILVHVAIVREKVIQVEVINPGEQAALV